MNREEVNEWLRNSFNSILNHKPTGYDDDWNSLRKKILGEDEDNK